MKISVLLPSHKVDTQAFMQKVEEAVPQNIDLQLIGVNDKEAKGKGWAVRMAMTQATGDVICFLDGDGDIDPRMIRRLLPFLEDHDIVVGVKAISGLWSRRILTYLSRIYLAILFNIKVDTQTGIKLFKRYAIKDWYSNGWLFDVEILADAKKDGMKMIEVPIEASVNKPMKFKSIWKTLKESVTLWLELH